MLSTDDIILEILNKAKNEGNRLLKYFKITYPNQELAQESNCIFVAVVSSENQLKGYDFEQFRDLVEILVVTKHEDNRKAISIIKAVSYEICRLIMENRFMFPNTPVIRNINPFFESNLVLSRGQIMINVNTEPVDFDINDTEIERICGLLQDNNNIILK